MRSNILRVLMYHRILDPRDALGSNPSVISATPDGFGEQVRHLAKHYCVLGTDELMEAMRRHQPLPKNAVLLTFDDAYRDFGEITWPLLRRAGLPATVFVPTAYPGDPQRPFWWDRLASAIAQTTRRSVELRGQGMLSLSTPQARAQSLRTLRAALKAIPHDQAMCMIDNLCAELGETARPAAQVLSWDQLRELHRDGVTIAAHTRTHPALTQLPLDQASAEIVGSRADLLRELGAAPPVFSYPFGDHNDAVVELVRQAGFELAVTCRTGFSRVGVTDPLRLRRVNISLRTTPLLFRLRLMRYGCNLDRLRHAARNWHAAAWNSRRLVID